MKKVTEVLLKMISRDSRALAGKKGNPFDYVESRKGILRELMISRESGNLIGLFSPILGEGMFLISVSSIESDNSIVFRKYDIRDGRLLSAGTLCLSDIRGVCPFIRVRQPDPRLSTMASNYLL